MKKANATVAEGNSPKSNRRFNFIDVLIILAVILLAAIVVNLFFPNSVSVFKSSDIKKEIQYTVEFVGVDEELIDKIKDNDTVLDSVSKYTVGTVIAVDRTTPYSVLQYDKENGVGHLATYDDKYNVLVTISVTAEYNESRGYSVGDRRIAVGEKLSLRFPDYASEGYCINLSAAE